jgi:uncharacterized protein YndB with AHSA1/START domain
METRITINATINASIEKVWSCWTKLEHITQWNFADPSWHCPYAENDFRVGGKYLGRMEAKDGSYGFDLEAIYDIVTEQKELTYTMADGRKATTIFEINGPNTDVTTIFDVTIIELVILQK